ncbi:MAG: helix-turn-helix domain-containing protein [Pirellulales bacterium]|nr:helix-turn-helix domain-containing protein [Pirellulales bacterium]
MKNQNTNQKYAARLLLDAREAAQALSICERTLRGLVARGELAVVRIGRRCVRYPVEVLERWIAQQSQNGGA